jgi:hypothetical protein
VSVLLATQAIENAVGLVLAVLLLITLVLVIVFPERF